MEVLPISDKNIDRLIRVHESAFQNFFLTELGPKFLRLYYKSVLKSHDGILLGTFENDKLIGFCAACFRSAGFNKSLIKSNLLKFGLISCKLLITKPKAIIRLARNLTKSDRPDDNGEYAELMSIGVDKTSQNSGAGKKMLAELENILRQKGIKQLSLTTDVEENASTLAFYKKRGFKEMYAFETYPNRKMYRLTKNLDKKNE